MGFDDEGNVAALKIRGYFLCGADMDLGFNDMLVLSVGADQVLTLHVLASGPMQIHRRVNKRMSALLPPAPRT